MPGALPTNASLFTSRRVTLCAYALFQEVAAVGTLLGVTGRLSTCIMDHRCTGILTASYSLAHRDSYYYRKAVTRSLILQYVASSPFPCCHDTSSGQYQIGSHCQASRSWKANPLDVTVLSFVRRYAGIRKQRTRRWLTSVLDQVTFMPVIRLGCMLI